MSAYGVVQLCDDELSRDPAMLLDDRKYAAFSDPDWLFEIKYDGYGSGAACHAQINDLTTLAAKSNGQVEHGSKFRHCTSGDIPIE